MTAQNSGETAPTGQTPLPENRHKTGFRGPSPDVGKATQIKPGEVRNPGGRPKTKLLSQAIREELEELAQCGDRTKAQALARKLVTNGLKAKPGQSTAAIREIGDRTEGRPVQSVQLTGQIDEATAARLADLYTRLFPEGEQPTDGK